MPLHEYICKQDFWNGAKAQCLSVSQGLGGSEGSHSRRLFRNSRVDFFCLMRINSQRLVNYSQNRVYDVCEQWVKSWGDKSQWSQDE